MGIPPKLPRAAVARRLGRIEDDVVVVVVWPWTAGGLLALVSEVPAHGLYGAWREDVGCRERLLAARQGPQRADVRPGRSVRVPGVVQVEGVLFTVCVGPHSGVDARCSPGLQVRAVDGGHGQRVERLVHVKGTRRSVRTRPAYRVRGVRLSLHHAHRVEEVGSTQEQLGARRAGSDRTRALWNAVLLAVLR